MEEFTYNDLNIVVFNDPEYGLDEDQISYARHYFGTEAEEYPTSKHGVKIFRGDEETNNCILIGSGGATGVSSDSALLDNDRLLVCCCNTLFCLAIPSLDLIWQTQADWATCFQIFKHEEDYITHGEVQISRIGPDGNIIWKFEGADIFVSMDGRISFSIENDHIALTDFVGTEYNIDFNGKSLK